MELNNKFNSLKTEYFKSVLNNDKKSQKKYLEELVTTGKELNKNVLRYEKELLSLGGIEKPKNKEKIVNKETEKTVEKSNKVKYQNRSFNIDNVYVKDNTIVVEFKHYVKKDFIKIYEEKRGNNYYQIFDFNGKFEDASPTKLAMDEIDKIKIYQYKDRILRIELKNKEKPNTIYILNKKQIIIKVRNKINSNKNTKSFITNSVKKIAKNKTIVIDSGHGGKDSGAVGVKKRYEKNSVLSVSKYLNNILKQRGYKVYLTRSSDRFIKVKNRTVLANEKKADIFLSIHANAAPKSVSDHAQGIETYFLSPARSERAKRVAALENSSDMREMNNNSQNTFLTILNQSKITSSQKLGIDVQQHLLYSVRKKYKDVVDGGVREGPFWVLVGAQMPSILIEIGYITHKEESRRLFDSSYQKQLALGIANGIDAYFLKNQ